MKLISLTNKPGRDEAVVELSNGAQVFVTHTADGLDVEVYAPGVDGESDADKVADLQVPPYDLEPAPPHEFSLPDGVFIHVSSTDKYICHKCVTPEQLEVLKTDDGGAELSVFDSSVGDWTADVHCSTCGVLLAEKDEE